MTTSRENPYAGQGAVLLDIGGDVGAVVVTMPADMLGAEVEIRPRGEAIDGHRHHPHVAVVNRPVGDILVPSLVFPAVPEGRYALHEKGNPSAHQTLDVRGGEVTAAAWTTPTGIRTRTAD